MPPKTVPVGFVRDPNTGRLFRVPEQNSGIELPFSTDGASSSSSSKPKQPQVKNLVDVFFKTQYGEYNLQRRATDLRTIILQHDETIAEGEIIINDSPNLYCAYSRIYDDSCYGIWHKRDVATDVGFLAEINISENFDFQSPNCEELLDAFNQRTLYYTSKERIVDLCFSKKYDDFFILASNTMTHPHRSTLKLIPQDEERVSMETLTLGAPMWSCCGSDFNRKIYVGMEKEIRTFDGDSPSFSEKKIIVNGKVHSLSTVSANTFLAGLHNGTVLIGDDRVRGNRVKRINLHNKGINDIKVLKGEKDIIFRSFDGTMFLYDIRYSHLIARFTGNTENISRMHLTVDEEERLICDMSGGQASLWTFDGGEPIKEVSIEKSKIHNPNGLRGGLIRKKGIVGLVLFYGGHYTVRGLL